MSCRDLAACDERKVPSRSSKVPISPKPNLHLYSAVVSEDTDVGYSADSDMAERTMHVAILDDDQSVRTAIGRVLKTSEMTVASCGTSYELFEAIADRNPDCLVLDLQMPGMNGLDVMKCLDRKGLRVPTIVISAHDEPGSRENCLCAGATAYLRKPLDADELLKTIDKVVAARADC